MMITVAVTEALEISLVKTVSGIAKKVMILVVLILEKTLIKADQFSLEEDLNDHYPIKGSNLVHFD